MTHLLDAYLAESRMKEGATLDPGTILQPTLEASRRELEKRISGSFTVLGPVEVPAPVLPPLVTQFPDNLIPRALDIPTAVYVGDDLGGGSNVPWSVGPVSMLNVPPVVGTMLIMIGGRVAVSIAVRGANDLYGYVKKKYHRRDVSMRVHTGVSAMLPGRKTDLRDGYDPSLPDGSDRVSPRRPKFGDPGYIDSVTPIPVPAPYEPGRWGPAGPPDILGGPAFPFGLITYNHVNSHGIEFGSWL